MPASSPRGLALRRAGDRAGALACFRHALRRNPEDLGLRLQVAHELRALGRLAEAETEYGAVLAQRPAALDVLLALGICARGRGDTAAALERFAAAAAAHPADPRARMAAGDALRAAGRAAEAEPHYRAVLAARPEDLPAMRALAACAQARGDPGEEHAWLVRADALEAPAGTTPTAARERVAQGLARRSEGDRAAALSAFQEAERLAPSWPRPPLEASIEAQALGLGAEAEALARRAVELDPLNPWALMRLGELARMAEAFGAALPLFESACRAAPAEPYAAAGLARAMAEVGRLRDGLTVLDSFVAAQGARPLIDAVRIGLLRETGHWPAAIETARVAAGRWQEDFAVWLECARAARLREDSDWATALLAPGGAPARTAVEHGRAEQARGWKAEDAWQLEEAAEHYAAALAALPDDPAVLADLARVCTLSLDLDAAANHLQCASRAEGAKLRLQGRSPRGSQSQLGQILDEFRCDAEALAALRLAFERPQGEARIRPLAAAVAERPQHTPSALSLVVTLRRAGRLGAGVVGPAPHSGPPIPRRIAQYWHEREPPPELLPLFASWREAHPQHAYRLFDDASAEAFLATRCGSVVAAAFRRAREPAQRADLFRLAWLAVEGGVWVDADDRCVGRLVDLIPPGARLFGYLEEYGALANNLLGAAPQDPVIKRALAQAVESVHRGGEEILWLSTGPGAVTRALAAVAASRPDPAAAAAGLGWAVVDRRAIGRVAAIHCFLTYKKAGGHWLQTAFGTRATPRCNRPHAMTGHLTGCP